MEMSIIIPAINEAPNLEKLLPYLRMQTDASRVEIFVSDGGSTDDSKAIAVNHGARFLQSPFRGRAAQMHFAASVAKGRILYFVHADVIPPRSFYTLIQQSLEAGKKAGCFSFRFDDHSKLLKLNARMTRMQTTGSGGGDQTLFILRDIYDELGGFNKELCIMEDFEFVGRIKRKYSLHIIKKDVVVSARKYENNSWLKVQAANSFVFLAYKLGASQAYLFKKYRKMLG